MDNTEPTARIEDEEEDELYTFYLQLIETFEDKIKDSFYINDNTSICSIPEKKVLFDPNNKSIFKYDNVKYMQFVQVTDDQFTLFYYIEVTQNEKKNAAIVLNFVSYPPFYCGIIYDNELKTSMQNKFFEVVKSSIS